MSTNALKENPSSEPTKYTNGSNTENHAVTIDNNKSGKSTTTDTIYENAEKKDCEQPVPRFGLSSTINGLVSKDLNSVIATTDGSNNAVRIYLGIEKSESSYPETPIAEDFNLIETIDKLLIQLGFAEKNQREGIKDSCLDILKQTFLVTETNSSEKYKMETNRKGFIKENLHFFVLILSLPFLKGEGKSPVIILVPKRVQGTGLDDFLKNLFINSSAAISQLVWKKCNTLLIENSISPIDFKNSDKSTNLQLTLSKLLIDSSQNTTPGKSSVTKTIESTHTY